MHGLFCLLDLMQQGPHVSRAKYSILFWSTKVLFFLPEHSCFSLSSTLIHSSNILVPHSASVNSSQELFMQMEDRSDHMFGTLFSALFLLIHRMRLDSFLELFSRGEALRSSLASICNSTHVVRAAAFHQR